MMLLPFANGCSRYSQRTSANGPKRTSRCSTKSVDSGLPDAVPAACKAGPNAWGWRRVYRTLVARIGCSFANVRPYRRLLVQGNDAN